MTLNELSGFENFSGLHFPDLQKKRTLGLSTNLPRVPLPALNETAD